jgi:hypothetical protein
MPESSRSRLPRAQGKGRLAFHQALLGSGLVRQIKTYSSRSQIKRQLIRVQGHPISMTIVEERR